MISDEQLKQIAEMVDTLPPTVRRSAAAQALVHSGQGMPQHIVVRKVGELVPEFAPILHRARLLQTLNNMNGGTRAAILGVKRMANAGEVPNKWLSDAVEAYGLWRTEESQDAPRAATPPPVPPIAVQAMHSHAAATKTATASSTAGHDTSAL